MPAYIKILLCHGVIKDIVDTTYARQDVIDTLKKHIQQANKFEFSPVNQLLILSKSNPTTGGKICTKFKVILHLLLVASYDEEVMIDLKKLADLCSTTTHYDQNDVSNNPQMKTSVKHTDYLIYKTLHQTMYCCADNL